MGILDKLVEKKDVMAYADHRIKVLKQKKQEVPETEPSENRQTVINRHQGRIEELERLKRIANNGKFREMSKDHYEKAESGDTSSTSDEDGNR